MYYIAFYNNNSITSEKYAISPAARKKAEYISEILSKKRPVTILSPAWSKSNERKHFNRSKSIKSNITILQFSTFGVSTKIGRIMQWINSLGQLFFYLMQHTEKNETIVVYHSLYLMFPVLLAKKFKKIKYILEVEERYQDILNIPGLIKRMEDRAIDNAEGYIFSAYTLNDICNKNNKPKCIISGSYQEVQIKYAKFDDGLIHCIYSGTFDEKKGGVYLAIEATEYLPPSYCVHICGFGTEAQVENVKKRIKTVIGKSRCKMIFEGMLDDEDYIRLLQKSHIGINTQNPNEDFSDTCFPSKILVYMSNGLVVVSSNNSAIKNSDVGQYLSYYQRNSARDVADAIIGANIKRQSNNIIYKLNQKAVDELSNLIENAMNPS